MRMLSRRMRWRTIFLVTDRNAPLISFSRPSNWLASFSFAESLMRSSSLSRSSLSAIASALVRSSVTVAVTASQDVVLVVEEARVVGGRLGGQPGELGLCVAQRRG